MSSNENQSESTKDEPKDKDEGRKGEDSPKDDDKKQSGNKQKGEENRNGAETGKEEERAATDENKEDDVSSPYSDSVFVAKKRKETDETTLNHSDHEIQNNVLHGEIEFVDKGQINDQELDSPYGYDGQERESIASKTSDRSRQSKTDESALDTSTTSTKELKNSSDPSMPKGSINQEKPASEIDVMMANSSESDNANDALGENNSSNFQTIQDKKTDKNFGLENGENVRTQNGQNREKSPEVQTHGDDINVQISKEDDQKDQEIHNQNGYDIWIRPDSAAFSSVKSLSRTGSEKTFHANQNDIRSSTPENLNSYSESEENLKTQEQEDQGLSNPDLDLRPVTSESQLIKQVENANSVEHREVTNSAEDDRQSRENVADYDQTTNQTSREALQSHSVHPIQNYTNDENSDANISENNFDNNKEGTDNTPSIEFQYAVDITRTSPVSDKIENQHYTEESNEFMSFDTNNISNAQDHNENDELVEDELPPFEDETSIHSPLLARHVSPSRPPETTSYDDRVRQRKSNSSSDSSLSRQGSKDNESTDEEDKVSQTGETRISPDGQEDIDQIPSPLYDEVKTDNGEDCNDIEEAQQLSDRNKDDSEISDENENENEEGNQTDVADENSEKDEAAIESSDGSSDSSLSTENKSSDSDSSRPSSRESESSDTSHDSHASTDDEHIEQHDASSEHSAAESNAEDRVSVIQEEHDQIIDDDSNDGNAVDNFSPQRVQSLPETLSKENSIDEHDETETELPPSETYGIKNQNEDLENGANTQTIDTEGNDTQSERDETGRQIVENYEEDETVAIIVEKREPASHPVTNRKESVTSTKETDQEITNANVHGNKTLEKPKHRVRYFSEEKMQIDDKDEESEGITERPESPLPGTPMVLSDNEEFNEQSSTRGRNNDQDDESNEETIQRGTPTKKDKSHQEDNQQYHENENQYSRKEDGKELHKHDDQSEIERGDKDEMVDEHNESIDSRPRKSISEDKNVSFEEKHHDQDETSEQDEKKDYASVEQNKERKDENSEDEREDEYKTTQFEQEDKHDTSEQEQTVKDEHERSEDEKDDDVFEQAEQNEEENNESFRDNDHEPKDAERDQSEYDNQPEIEREENDKIPDDRYESNDSRPKKSISEENDESCEQKPHYQDETSEQDKGDNDHEPEAVEREDNEEVSPDLYEKELENDDFESESGTSYERQQSSYQTSRPTREQSTVSKDTTKDDRSQSAPAGPRGNKASELRRVALLQSRRREKREARLLEKRRNASPPRSSQSRPHTTATGRAKTCDSSKKRERPFSPRRAKSARPGTRGNTADSDGRSKQNEFFRVELKRLEKSLARESSKIQKPVVKQHYPYVFNDLEPYYNTHTAKYLIYLPDEVRHGYVSRSTAGGLTDPWDDLKMDRTVLPRIHARPVTRAESKKEKRSTSNEKRPAKEGSTRLPKFPVVELEASDLTNRQLYFSDVPMLRKELKEKYSANAKQKIDKDCERTTQDYYRMELDKLEEIHPLNRQNMRRTYFAYLQNTPGSKKAIYSCVKKSEKASQ